MASFLKKVNEYVKFKVLNKIDSRLWSFSEPFQNYLIYHTEEREVINNYYKHIDGSALSSTDPEDKYVLENFTRYIYKFQQPVLVEPLHGWVITSRFRVFKRSFPYVEDPWDYRKRMPETINYLVPKKIVDIETCISLRYNWSNYYHFFFDAMAQLHMAEGKIPAEVPILVPWFFPELQHVAAFRKLSNFLEGRKIIVQGKNEYYRVQQLYLLKDTFYSDAIFSIVASLGSHLVTPAGGGRKLFLKRARNRARSLENSEEIERIAAAAGLEVVDTDGLDFKAQIALFGQADTVVGIHGAGLTNIIFRNKQPLRLLELFPGNLAPSHYSNISKQFGYSYSSMKGDDLVGVRFRLDPEQFRQKLEDFLK